MQPLEVMAAGSGSVALLAIYLLAESPPFAQHIAVFFLHVLAIAPYQVNHSSRPQHIPLLQNHGYYCKHHGETVR